MRTIRQAFTYILIITALLYLRPGLSDSNAANSTERIIRLATTTSTDNSGLLAHLLPGFEAASGYRVHVIAVGTGKALRMGRDGDADVLLVHAPAAEEAFIQAGYGERRTFVMYNDFVLLGPAPGSAGIVLGNDISEALGQIAEKELTFISRGDNSGTHKKERSLWQALGIEPRGTWYREVGQGMGKVLQMASELDAFTLSDRGTWLAYQDKSTLQVLNRPDPLLHNPYHIIALNPLRYPDNNHAGANALIAWLTSAEGQTLIGQFTMHDTRLFTPAASASALAEQMTDR